MARGSGVKINLRWLIQALAFIGCIYFFLQVWEGSKQLVIAFSLQELGLTCANLGGFLVCFFVMTVTSYLKQKVNGTLKNPIPVFEKLLTKVGLI